jgi:murein DD-endopeptidase MepM/ murein hydrolase activator NlpD
MRGSIPALILGSLLLAQAPAEAMGVRIVPPSLHPGDVALVVVEGAADAREVDGRLGDQPLRFFSRGDERAAVVGIDLDAKPGPMTWRIAVIDDAGISRELSGRVVMGSRRFPIERLTLPAPMVDLDPEVTRRVEREAVQLNEVFATIGPERLWRNRFTPPVPGQGHGFGSRRVINGQPRAPHTGLDFAAERGTPVMASNRGRVTLTGEFFFAGRFVVLDHGLGLYTLYYHLDRVDAARGAMVERGEVIGAVGATGRATGPHLHWAARLGSARVDPAALLSLPLGE